MQKKSLTIHFEEFDSMDELPEADRRLLQAAKASLEKAYAPYSGFQVAAAVRLENGAILTGANQENAAYPMCLCAERVALAAALAAHPQSPVQSIAVTVRYPRKKVAMPATPCGACRQVIAETEDRFGQAMSVLLQGESGAILKFKAGRDLLPLGFSGSTLV
jgi:cytidine deaminase